MKAHRFLILAFLIISGAVFMFTGCKYDVAEPMWEKPYDAAVTPQITGILPATEAKAGANTITINGQNLVSGTDTTLVYFDGLESPSEIISASPTSIVVRRPNISGNTVIKIVPYGQNAIAEAKMSYKVAGVLEDYGSFLDNVQLNVVTADQSDNIYVVDATTRYVTKVEPNGAKAIISDTSLKRVPLDGSIGPDGKIYYCEKHRDLDVFDPATGEVKPWVTLPSGKIVTCGDFDANGYFYAAGTKSDIVILNSDGSVKNADGSQGIYKAEEVLALRIAGGYIYIASRPNNKTAAKIYRHPLTDGVIGVQEPLFDMASDTSYAARLIKAINVSESGAIFVASDVEEPLLIIDPNTKKADIFYKTIIPAQIRTFSWGGQGNVYMITGNGTKPQDWKIYRVDIGEKQKSKN